MPRTRTSRDGRLARLNVIAAVLLAIAGAIWCSQAIRKAERRTGNDLVGYLEASRALYAGSDPYHLPNRFPYIYPLFLATVIRPLAAVPAPVASVAWFLLQAACLWYVLRTAADDAGLRPAWRAIAAAAIVAVFGDVLQNEFLNGQVNVIVLALAMGAVHVAGRMPRAAAALLGAAIAVKLTPALFLVYFSVERRYRAVVESVLWAGVFVLSPWLVVGDRLWALYGAYLQEFIIPRTSSAGPHVQAIFFTPHGFWGWLTGSAPGRALMLGTSIAVVAALIAWQWPRRRSESSASVYAASIPLLSPMSEVHHLTFLIPAAVVVAAHVPERVPVVTVTTVFFVVLIWIGRFDRTGPWYFLATLSLIASTCAALQRRRELST